MPSTYSSSLKLELIQNNEQSGIWGQTTNKNFNLIEQAISGVLPLTLTGDYTLSSLDGIIDEARNAVINCSGLLAAPANVIAPSVQKTYIITNNTGANVTIKTATGNGVTVLNTSSALVYCDGTDFYNAVTINNVIGDQTISGNEVILGNVTSGGNLTVTSNVSSGTGNLTFTSNNGIVTAAVNTGAYIPPTGTSAERPSAPNGGMSRFNTDIGAYEIFNGAVWQPITGAYAVSYLLVAGGAGGGNIRGGGGGAGGMLSSTTSVQPGTSYAITVGAGGASAANGATSSIGSIVSATGGGFGGSGNGTGGPFFGGNGGSGGGAPSAEGGGLPLLKPGGTGIAGQGNNGGSNNTDSQNNGGGGGGAGAAGADTPSGVGGAGRANSLRTGSSIFYAGGGGAGGANNPALPGSAGGVGGGGNGGQGGVETGTNGIPGTANTGGGGGGAGGTAGTPKSGGAGGSGICVLVYPSATQRATGGIVTTYTINNQVYWVHTFTTSGTFIA